MNPTTPLEFFDHATCFGQQNAAEVTGSWFQVQLHTDLVCFLCYLYTASCSKASLLLGGGTKPCI